ncbi:MAG: hypothetical protein ACRD3T_18240 [Terriglobia bacterium]
MSITGIKRHAHESTERLTPNHTAAVAGLLEAMPDPAAGAIAHVPVDDEALAGKGLGRGRFEIRNPEFDWRLT